MKVLVACEFSGRVRDAFARLGHDAWSCDLLPSESPGNHIRDSVFEHSVVNRGWDMMIAHWDCTFLTVSGARWMSIERREEAQLAALHSVKALWKFPIEKVVIEIQSGGCRRCGAGRRRSSSRGCSATRRAKPHACGYAACRRWCRGSPPRRSI